VQNRIKIAFY